MSIASDSPGDRGAGGALRRVPWRTWPALLLLGFASGLPNPLVDAVLQQWLTAAGWSRADVILAGYLTLPYLLKPLWAPAVDRIALPWLGRRRGWLALSQLATIAGLAGCGLAGADAGPALLVAAALAAVASATQDLVVNAATASAVPAPRLGVAAALSVWGYRAALAVALAAAPRWAAEIGWASTYLVLAAGLVPGLLGSLLLPEPPAPAPPTWRAAVAEPARALLADHGGAGLGWLVLAVALIRLPDVLAATATGRFLAERIDPVALGDARAWALPAAALGGLAAAGIVATARGAALPIAIVLMAVSNLAYIAIDRDLWTGFPGALAALIIDGACGACAGTIVVAWLMSLCRPSLAATQYALLLSLTLIAPNLLRPFAAPVVAQWTWTGFFLLTVAAAAPALLAVYRASLRKRYFQNT